MNKSLLERVRECPPDWAANLMEACPFDMELEQYVKSRYCCDYDSINVHDIAGASSPDYAGRTWLDILHDTDLESLNPSYYYETARFLLFYEGKSIIHGVSLEQLTIDYDFKLWREI